MYQSKSRLEVAVEAAARVDAVLAKKGKIKPNPIASVLATANKSTNDLFQTEFEINDVPLTARNLLTKGITQEEINHFSGASISTRGRYVTKEDRAKLPKSERPLYLFIQGPNKQSLDLAIQRIDSLIKEVMEQEKFKMGPPPPVINMQTSLPGMEKVIIGLDNAPPSFDVRNKVLGPGGANLQYISNETGAIVTLRGRNSGYPEAGTGQESPEPLHICVEHEKIEVLQAARQLSFNLVDTIQQEFAQCQPQLPPPQQGSVQTVSLQSDHLPPGLVATSLQMPVLTQQHATVSQLVNMPPPSLSVPPPQIVQQPPPSVSLPPPGIHIPAHQGPLVPQQQGVVQQQILQQPPPNVPPTGLPPPTQVQYIQTANGQTLMAYQTQPQVKAEAAGQVQLIQTQAGQPQQLQIIPGTSPLLMQQPQQVTMLLQYQQQNELGKGGRLVAGQQRLATPVQIQLQPGVQLINPQLLQSGQTQFQLQLQQPLTQQLLQQAVRAVAPQQVTLQQARVPQQQEQQLQFHQQHIFQLQQQPPPQHLQQQNLQLQQNAQVQTHPQIVQQQVQIQQGQQQIITHSQTQLQQTQQIQQQLQQPQQQLQQLQVQQSNQQIQQTLHQQQMQQPQQIQQIQQTQPQQMPQPQPQQMQQSQPQQMPQPQQTQQLQQPPQIDQPQQQMQQTQQIQQAQQQIQQTQQQTQQTEQQIQPQQQSVPHLQSTPQVQQPHMQQSLQSKEGQQQKNQQFQKSNQNQLNQQPSSIMSQSKSQPQQGQKRRYEDQNLYQGAPQPVPPPKMTPPKQANTSGVG